MLEEALRRALIVTGTPFNDETVAAFMEELVEYKRTEVVAALKKCAKTTKGRLTLMDVVSMLQPKLLSADEAFGRLIAGWENEAVTIVVPEIAMLAAGEGASNLFNSGDKIGARMAFRSAYERLVTVEENVKWVVSAGTDKTDYADKLTRAAKDGLIPMEHAAVLLPANQLERFPEMKLLADKVHERNALEQQKMIGYNNSGVVMIEDKRVMLPEVIEPEVIPENFKETLPEDEYQAGKEQVSGLKAFLDSKKPKVEEKPKEEGKRPYEKHLPPIEDKRPSINASGTPPDSKKSTTKAKVKESIETPSRAKMDTLIKRGTQQNE